MTFKDFLSPLNAEEFGGNSGSVNLYRNQIYRYIDQFPNLEDVDIVLLGVNELRDRNNNFLTPGISFSADALRRQFYRLYKGNYDVKVADIGNINAGNSFSDSAFAFHS